MKPPKGRRVPPQPRTRLRPAVSAALVASSAIVALILLTWSNSFSGGFVLDNRGLILNDPRLRAATADNLRLILQHTYWWPTGEGGVYRPFTTLTYLFNYAVLGNRDNPFGYHLINFLLHSVNALLVFALARRFMRGLWPAFFVAALQAVHPALTEATTNIVGRADMLAATGLLGGFLAYLRFREANGRARWLWLAAVAAMTAVGVFSKENAVVLPVLIVVYELMFGRDTLWIRKAPGLVASLIPIGLMFWQRSLVLAASLPKEVPFTDNPILGASFWAGRLTAIDVLVRYLWLIVWPARLSADYSWSEIPIARGNLEDWLALAAVLALLAVLIPLCRRDRGLFFLVFVGIAWMAPVSNVFFPIGTIMAERFLYLAVAGAMACLVAACYRFRFGPAALSLLILALGARTWVRNSDWQNDLSIAAASVAASPGSYKTHDLLANVLYTRDRSRSGLDAVIRESEKSRAILDPLPDSRNLADPYRSAGAWYLERGDAGKAEMALLRFLAIEKAAFAEFRRSLKPGMPSAESAERITAGRQADANTLLSAAYLKQGDLIQADAAAAQARTLNPLSSPLYRQRAEIALARGRFDEAASTYIEGAFVMADGSLRQALVEMYRRNAAPGSCALIDGPRGPALNPGCPQVHAHLCGAQPGTIATLLSTGQTEQARERRRMFTSEFGCPEP